MPAELKLTAPLVALLRERRAAGLSYRELAAWLGATHGVAVSHATVRQALDKAPPPSAVGAPARPTASDGAKVVRKRATRPTGSQAGKAPEGEPAPEAPEERVDDAGSDEADIETINRVIRDLERDIEKARLNGATQALATLTRLLADLLKRRADLRPPAPMADVDAELMGAGAKAVDKLRKLVDVEETP
jgi:hypothetical protein